MKETNFTVFLPITNFLQEGKNMAWTPKETIDLLRFFREVAVSTEISDETKLIADRTLRKNIKIYYDKLSDENSSLPPE